ncbi:uncharacterized protein LOC111294728 [Durio zibethinus]|uniref:Uncharacterized protein LOC111294728 n=1 Tax=Durio zibethinus TaxID=66656 RepID=A0A6P5YTM5_DURZI|nr:uncharacterized protein LOC111294728 [Durio zibethinus]
MEEQLFDEVIMAAITQTPNIEKIQNEIAKNLGLKFDEASLDARRVQLRDRLKKQKKVLIILDNIWVTLDMNVLGLPSRLAQKCAELPIAIATIANTLKSKKTLFELRNALQELKRLSFRNFKSKQGDVYPTEVAKGWFGQIPVRLNSYLGSLRLLVDFRFK